MIEIDDEEKRVENDKHNKKVAREVSWLCELFQKHKLNADDKQLVIKQVINAFLLAERKRKELVTHG